MKQSNALYPHRASSKEFRLLQVTKSSSGILQCQLKCYEVNSAPPYNALSYSWGFVDISHSIQCNGQTILVSKSVQTALNSLHHLELAGESKLLWIDAICINQEDVAEKTQQVRMMQSIYERAETVLIWLGEESSTDQRGLDLLQKVWKVRAEIEDINEEKLALLDLPHQDDHLWDDLLTFITKPWFNRVWIIQELICSSNALMISGRRTVPPAEIFEACAALWDSNFWRVHIMTPRFAGRHSGNALVLWKMYKLRKQTENLNLSYCLLESWPFSATDPRDKIFAVTFLCDQRFTNLIDYNKSASEVLIETAKALIAAEQCPLDVLCFSRMLERGDGPSWVPNWISSSLLIYPLHEWSANPAKPSDSRSFSIQNNMLLVTSSPFDRIVQLTTDELPRWDDWYDIGRRMKAAEDRFHNTFSIHASRTISKLSGKPDIIAELNKVWMGFMKCFWRLLRCHIKAKQLACSKTTDEAYWYTLNHNKDLDTPSGNVEYFKSLAEKLEAIARDPVAEDIPETTSSFLFFVSLAMLLVLLNIASGLYQPMMRSIVRTSLICLTLVAIPYSFRNERHQRSIMLRIILKRQRQFDEVSSLAAAFAWRNRGRRFCITGKGYMGWTPAWTDVGDDICAFEGSRFPFVIRKSSISDSDHYELLGDIYLHGITEDILHRVSSKRDIVLT